MSNEEYANRWDAIFGVHPEEQPDSEQTNIADSEQKEKDDNS